MIMAAVSLLAAGCARAETRVALIVGNASYSKNELKLANPANDAASMQRALASAGFTTIVRINATRVELYRALDEFATKLRKDPHSVGLFYYAGHGMQVDGANYLIPVDADIQSVPDLEANAFDVGRVLRALQDAQNEMNIVILDACRNNPLPKSRGAERGLARMNAPSGTFIAYAAAPGQTAQDGSIGANGVFTGELVKAMAEPGVPLEQMYKHVIASVKLDTRGAQQPWSESSIQGDFFFHAGAAADPAQIELSFWESIKNSKNPADFRAYLARFPRGEFAVLAANRIKAETPGEPGKLRVSKDGAAAATAGPRQTTPGGTIPAAPDSARCGAILERVQIGDPLSDDDRAYLTTHCR
jgi:caspase domain-containing protein